MNKSDITNIFTILLLVFGYANDNELLYTIGIFAFSGAITNTLAIYMLFEKVPFLYGSGIIEKNLKFLKLQSMI